MATRVPTVHDPGTKGKQRESQGSATSRDGCQ